MASKKNVTDTTQVQPTLDLALQQKGLDLVKQLYLAGVAPTGPDLTAYNSCARGLPTQGDVAQIEALLSTLRD